MRQDKGVVKMDIIKILSYAAVFIISVVVISMFDNGE